MLSDLPAHVENPDPQLYWSDNYVVLDFETTTYNKGSPLDPRNRIVLACWSVHRSASGTGDTCSSEAAPDHKRCFANEYAMGELVRDCERADFIVAHNSKFELGWLRRCGLDLHKVVIYDTLIGEYVRGGNRWNLAMLSLSNTLKRYGLKGKTDLVGTMIKLGICPSVMPESWLLEYCERDVEATHEVFLQQREVLKERGLIHLQYQRCLVTPALTDIEFNGMQLDYKMVVKEAKEQEELYAKKTAALQEFMGGVPPSSTKQKGEYVYDTLKFDIPKDFKGKPYVTKLGSGSVGAEALGRLKPKTQKQHDWLRLHKEWAGINSDVTKYLRKFEACCAEAGGRLQATFNQCVSKTHRLTSSGFDYKVQFQNLNRKFKPVFMSRYDGWLIGEADGAQLEFRIAVHMGRDKKGLYDITHGEDVHRFSAATLLEIDEDEVTKGQRQAAKEETFKPLYGGKSGTAAQRRYYAAFAEKYHQIAKTQSGWTHKVLKDKKLTTEYGLIHYWPNCTMSERGYIAYTTNIYNYPVQGFATAEIIPLALVCAWHRMVDMESFLVNTVHDSIIAELHPEEVELWHEIAQQCLIKDCYRLLKDLYGISLTVPLGAGVMIGTHWANSEAKAGETTYEASREMYEDAARKENML